MMMMKAQTTIELNITIDLPLTAFSIKELSKDSWENGEMAVYFLTRKDQVVYIGKTKNLQTRMKAHIRKVKIGKIDDKVIICRIDRDLLIKLETSLIRLFQPEHNKGWGDNRDTYGY